MLTTAYADLDSAIDAVNKGVVDAGQWWTHYAMGKNPAAVFYASEGFDLYFLSSPSTRHCADLSGNPRVAATIQEDYADWSQIRGVQLEGVARPLAGEHERREAVQARAFSKMR